MTQSLTLRTIGFAFVFLILFLFQVQGWSYLTSGIGLSLAFALMVFVVNDNGWRLRLSLSTIIVSALVLWIIISAALSVIPSLSIFMLPTIIFAPLLLLTVMGIRGPFMNDDKLWWGLIGVGLMTACYALYQFYNDTGRFDFIANLPFYNPNSLGVFLGMSGLCTLYYMSITKTKLIKAALLLAVLMTFAGIVASASKASILGFVLAGIALVVLMRTVWRRNIIWWGLTVFLLMAIPFLMSLPQSPDKQDVIANNLSPALETTMKRIPIWQGAIHTAMSERPIIGTGIGTYKDVYLKNKRAEDPSAGLHAHNDILHIWVEMGAIGVILFTLLGFAVLRVFITSKSEDHILPIIILFFGGGMALVTPIILLPPTLMIMALACIPFISIDKGRIIDSKIPHYAMILILVLCAALSAKNTYEKYITVQIRTALYDNNFDAMRGYVNDLDAVSLRQNPSVPIYRASLMLLLFEEGKIADDMRDKALDEMQGYIHDGQRRNPYNPENIYYQAMLEEKRGDIPKAKSLWRQSLKDDPSYLGARIKLMKHARDNAEMLDLILTGLPIKYWKQDPKNFYSTALIFAKETKNKDLYETVQEYLQRRLRLG